MLAAVDEISFKCDRGRTPGNYSVTLGYKNRFMRLAWFRDWDKPRPELRAVLGVMLLDNALAALPFEEWCAESHCPSAGPLELQLYNQQRELWAQMEATFGSDYVRLKEKYTDA
jgi:hypothetical protein